MHTPFWNRSAWLSRRIINAAAPLILTLAIGAPLVLQTAPAWALEGVLRANDPNARITLRQAPDPTSTSLGYGLVGDRVQIFEQAPGADGYLWYRVRFDDSGAVGWVRGTLITVLGGTPAQPNLPRPPVNPAPPSGTLFTCNTPSYGIRVFQQTGRTLMNVFDRANGVTWLSGVPVSTAGTPDRRVYTYRGEVVVQVSRPNSGGCSIQVGSNPPEFER